MKFLPIGAAALLLVLTSQFAAADDKAEGDGRCLQPDPPAIPSGRRSKEDDMEKAIASVKSYIDDNANFRACLQRNIDRAKSGEIVLDQHTQAGLARLLDESYEMDTFVAETINREIRIYKSLHGEND